MINLGDRVKDKITGLKGIVIGKTDWLYGCLRLVVQPEESKDGKPADTFNVDEPQVELLKAAVIKGREAMQTRHDSEPVRRHGPRPDASPRSSVSR